jgi:Mg/Co/Ni transporter MgtE
MNTEFLSIAEDMTVDATLQQVRLLAPDVETIFYVYVTDTEDQLRGVVSLKELLVSPPQTIIAEIMQTNLKTVDVDAEPEDILEIIAKYNLIAVPVLEGDKLAGIVTVDDILEMFLPYALKRKRRHH